MRAGFRGSEDLRCHEDNTDLLYSRETPLEGRVHLSCDSSMDLEMETNSQPSGMVWFYWWVPGL